MYMCIYIVNYNRTINSLEPQLNKLETTQDSYKKKSNGKRRLKGTHIDMNMINTFV
jgi:hypothetical protein